MLTSIEITRPLTGTKVIIHTSRKRAKRLEAGKQKRLNKGISHDPQV